MYGGKSRQLSPLVLGTLRGEHRLWAYQFGGDSTHICKCFVVAKLSAVELYSGEWTMPEDDPGSESCIDTVLKRA